MSKQKIIYIGQWVAIGLLLIACFCIWKKTDDSVVSDANYNSTETKYVNVSSDKTLAELKKTNEELYDSIKKLSDVKEAIQIKYIIHHNTDTVYLGEQYRLKDSTYHYSQVSDTINYDLNIRGNDVKWFKLNFSIQDSLMIVTRSSNGKNETTITHSNMTDITNATVYVPKKTFIEKVKENTYIGVGIGAGFGIFNKKPDIYIGINAGIKF